MKHVNRFLNVLLIVLAISLFLVPAALAQEGAPPTDLASTFAPILAASLSVERFLQLIRNLISPDPEAEGILKRGGKGLRYYTTVGGTLLGLAMAFLGNLHLLADTGITVSAPVLDNVLTGVVVGMGTEFVHEVIGVVAEGKNALRGAPAAPKG